MERPNQTVVELWIGSVCYNLLAMVIGIWFVQDKPAWMVGILAGCLMSCYLSYHMARSIARSLDNEAGASRIMRVSSLLRYGLVVLLLLVAYYMPHVNPIATFFGLMGLKAAAYLWPLTHRVISSFRKSEEEVGEK